MAMTKMTFRQALTDAMRQEMRRDCRVVVLGEDVGRHGGARGATQGLWEEFGPRRVIDTPISEMAVCGSAVGMAYSGFRPIVENYIGDIIMFMADSLVTSASKLHFATGGQFHIPLVVRGADGSRPEGGPHQDSLAVWFAHVPGLKVVVPATAADAKGLLAAAIRDENPVVCMEPSSLYDTVGFVPDGEYVTPIGEAKIRHEGKDVTLVTVGGCLPDALAARDRWQQEDVEIEVVDLRSLRPLDVKTILRSVRKTRRLVVVHEGWKTYGISSEIVACVSEAPELLLDAPAQRIGTHDTHIPASVVLTKAVLPNAQRIDAAIETAVRGAG